VIAYIIEIFLNQLADYIQENLHDEHDSLHKEFYEFLGKQKVKVRTWQIHYNLFLFFIFFFKKLGLSQRKQRSHL